ncbi:MAG TPA: hypothetical protein VMF87_01105 [Streptosporangiaceae bacterium]|nr:hypothetical protein [Streptosporangiaceae bacterium]
MDSGLVGSGYADHLTDADLGLLVSVSQETERPGGLAAGGAWLRSHPDALPELIGDPRVFQAVFGPEEHAPPAAARATLASPFLIFAVAVHRAAAELESMDHVPERSGQRQRVPLFDAPELRDFLGSPARRLFLAELLGSFTRNAGAPYRAVTGRQPGARPARRAPRRFSELDLGKMAGLLDAVPENERAGVYRRLGDVALFLTGVFPDYAVAHALGPVSAARLLRAARAPEGQQDRLASAPAIDLFEYLGARWYRAAWGLAPARTARLAVVAEVADRFRQARRVLNHIADRCLFPQGNPWFAPPAP